MSDSEQPKTYHFDNSLIFIEFINNEENSYYIDDKLHYYKFPKNISLNSKLLIITNRELLDDVYIFTDSKDGKQTIISLIDKE